MTGVEHRTITAEDDGLRLDRWFKRHYPGLRFGRLAKLLRTGQVRLDGKRAKPGDRIVAGQQVRLPPQIDTADEKPAKAPAAVKLSKADIAGIRNAVLHRDDSVLVINKPAGLAVQGGSGIAKHLDGMLDALAFDRADRPKLVHRLDRDTSGVLVLARTANAAAALTKAFRRKDTVKIYWALVRGVPDMDAGVVDAPLAKQGGAKGERMAIDPDHGQRAITRFAVVDKAARKASWLVLRPLTGRTHQLRVHCAYMNCPVIGDGKYGGKEAYLGGDIAGQLHLHARSLTIAHPDGGRLVAKAPLPSHMEESWRLLGFSEGEAGEAENLLTEDG